MGKRRISTSFLIVFLVVTLAACTSNGSGSSGSNSSSTSTSTASSSTASSSASSSASTAMQSSATGSVTAPAAKYEEIPCPTTNVAGLDALNFPAGVTCGYLIVPENRAKPDGRQIRIFFSRAPAVTATGQEPLVWLAGGPGGAGSFNVASMVAKGVNADRDVIFVDQRGTLHADPLLPCPEVDQFENDTVDLPMAAVSTTTLDTAAYQACRDRLAATGVDLASYNTTENAADIADLRVAMGIVSWNVYGVSYGTRLALSLLRDHPEGIKSMVLDSVSPPVNNIVDTWWSAPASSFKAIFAACEAQPACAAAYPNLAADFTDTVNRLNTTPLVVQTQDSAGAPVTVNIDGFALAYAVINASEKFDPAAIPMMVGDIAKGDGQGIATVLLNLLNPPTTVGLAGVGLGLTVFCQESENLTTEAEALATAKSYLPDFPDDVLKLQPKRGRLFTECPVWDVGKADPSVIAPTVSDVPVLVLEGAFDAATAPEWVDLITPDLPNSQVVTFPMTGHSVVPKSSCGLNLLTSFLADRMQKVDGSCVDQTLLTFKTG